MHTEAEAEAAARMPHGWMCVYGVQNPATLGIGSVPRAARPSLGPTCISRVELRRARTEVDGPDGEGEPPPAASGPGECAARPLRTLDGLAARSHEPKPVSLVPSEAVPSLLLSSGSPPGPAKMQGGRPRLNQLPHVRSSNSPSRTRFGAWQSHTLWLLRQCFFRHWDRQWST